MRHPTRKPSRRPFSACLLLCALAATACSGGGGDRVLSVRLASDSDCYGIEIDVVGAADDLGGADPATVCTPSTALLDAGCEGTISVRGEDLVLATTGCFVENGASLFECTAPGGLANRLREESVTRCGCGCRPDCPSSPTVAICTEGGDDCALVPAARSGGGPADADVNTDSQRTVTVTSTMPCGTCCDAYTELDFQFAAGPSLRELEFEVRVDGSGRDHCEVDSCEIVSSLGGPNRLTWLDGDHARVCVAAARAFSSPHTVLRCDGYSIQMSHADVRGLDDQLQPVESPTIDLEIVD